MATSSLMEELPFYVNIPKGFVNLKEFSELTQATTTEIRRAIGNGKIPRKDVIVARHPVRKSKQFMIRWNTTGYNFIVARKKHLWPKDFKQNPEKEYKPIETETLKDDDLSREPLDLADAKLLTEKLKIKKLEYEMRLSNNRAILMEDILAQDIEFSSNLMGELTRGISSASPLLAATSDVKKCNEILKEKFKSALNLIETYFSSRKEKQ